MDGDKIAALKVKRKATRHQHHLLVPRPQKRRRRKKKREPVPFERPLEDYTDCVCLLVRAKGCVGHAKTEVLIDADRLVDVAPYEWRIKGDGGDDHRYVVCNLSIPGTRGWRLSLHRFLTDPPPDMVVDHKHNNVWDNRGHKLRVCTDQQNRWNSSPPKDKAGRYKGVTQTRWGKKPQWVAVVKGLTVGTFAEEDFAAYAYNIVAQRHYGEFAYKNEVTLRDEEAAFVLLVVEDTDRKREQRKYWASQPKASRQPSWRGPVFASDLVTPHGTEPPDFSGKEG